MTKTKSHRLKQIKPNLIKYCLLCDSKIQVKYIPPKKKYSLKNNWGYWINKETAQHKYICSPCLMKLHRGNMRDWIPTETRADSFYNYIYQGSFK